MASGDGGRAIEIGQLAIALAIKTQALEQGIKTAQQQLRGLQRQINDTMNNSGGNNRLEQQIKDQALAFGTLSAAAGGAFVAIVSAINSGTGAFNKYNNAVTGLHSVVLGTNNDFAQAQKLIDSYTEDGLVPATQAAATLKNLLSTGFSFDQAKTVMDRFKDSAAFGRQGALSMGDAIERASEGLKNQNSTLVDNVGVTKNLSVMWDEYAKTIGKTGATLTDAEKVQAAYNGILSSTNMQLGDAAKLSNNFGGSQAQAAAATEKMKQAFGEALVPSMQTYYQILIPLIKGTTEFISQHKDLVGTVTIVSAGLLFLVSSYTAITAGINICKAAVTALNIEWMKTAATPIGLALTVIGTGVAYLNIQAQKAKDSQNELNSALERFNKLKANGATAADAPQLNEDIKSLEEATKAYDKFMSKVEELKKSNSDGPLFKSLNAAAAETGVDMENLSKSFNKLGIDIDYTKNQTQELNQRLKEMKAIKAEAVSINIDEYNSEAKTIALKYKSNQETQNLINTYKNASKGSKEWTESQKKLSDQFPQFSSASGIEIEAIEKLNKSQQDSVNVEWKALQDKIQIRLLDLKSLKETKQAAITAMEDYSKGLKEDSILTKPFGNNFAGIDDTIKKNNTELNKAKEYITAIDNSMQSLEALKNSNPSSVKGVGVIDNNDYGSSKSAEDAMQQALKVYEYKKHLGQLTSKDEINMLKDIEAKYADTAEKRMEMEQKIFDVQQEMIQKKKQLEQTAFENSKKWIDNQKNFGVMSAEQELAAYERIKNRYKDNSDIQSEMNIKIYETRIKIAEDYYKKEQEAFSKAKNEEIKIAEDAESKKEKLLENEEDAQVKAVERRKDAELAAIESTTKAYEKAYKNKVKLIEDESNAQIKSLQDKITGIDTQTANEEQLKQEQDRQKKLADLKSQYAQLIQNNTKESQEKAVSIQQQIADMEYEIERNNILKQRELQKANLQEQIDAIKSNTDLKKQQLEEEYNQQKEALDRQKETIQQNAEDEESIVKQHYSNLLDEAKSLSESRINLLKSEIEQSEKLYDSLITKARQAISMGKDVTDAINSASSSSDSTYTYNGGTIVGLSDNIAKNIPNLTQAISDMSKKMNVDMGVARDMVINDYLNSTKSKSSSGTTVNVTVKNAGSVITEKNLVNSVKSSITDGLKRVGLA